MRALSLWQPWASLIALGCKRVETRGWRLDYRGRLAIHTTRTWQASVLRLLRQEGPFALLVQRLLADQGIDALSELPTGAVVCTARVVNCRPTDQLLGELDPQELALGDYRPGRWGIMLADVEPVVPPVPALGRQGIWDWQPSVRT